MNMTYMSELNLNLDEYPSLILYNKKILILINRENQLEISVKE